MGRTKVKKKRKQVNSFPMVDFSSEFMEEVDDWYKSQPPTKDNNFNIPVPVEGELLISDEILRLMRNQYPKEYITSEKLAFEMIDVITDASKKFKHLSIEESCYWMHLAAYVNFYIEQLREQHHQQA